MSGDRKDGQKGQPDDVRDMLRQLASQIKDQIADVDRRHNAALKTMEQRLVSQTPLPIDTDAWDADAAEALTRLYETDAPAPETVSSTAMIRSTTRGPLVAEAAAPSLPSSSMKATTPLKPAAPPPPAAPIYFADPPIEPSPAPLHVTPTTSGTTQITAPVTASMRMTPDVSAVAAAASTAAAGWLASDRAWLDARLADLHARVDATLTGFDPAPIVAPLNQRIDRLEADLHQRFDALALTSDDGRLTGIETDVAELKTHVVSARGQLKRLDHIERHLADIKALADSAQTAVAPAHLVDATAPDRLGDLEAMVRDLHAYAADQQTNATPPPELPDFHGLAEKAAERAAQNIVEQHKDLFSPAKRAEMHAQALAMSRAPTGPSLDDMQSLFERYQEEQRREQDRMTTTLNTMQEALIRLIDRIEELASDGGAVEDTVESAPSFIEVADERSPQPGRRVSDRMSDPVDEPMVTAAPSVAPMAVAPASPRAPSRQPQASPPRAPIVQQEPEANDAAALAAERARVQAERAQERGPGRRAPMPRPQMTVAADPVAEATSETATATVRPARKAKAGMTVPKKGLIAAAVGGAFVIAAGFFALPILTKRVAETKLGDRVPRVSPATVPAPAPRAAVPTETFEPPAPRAQPATTLPELQPSTTTTPRPQPASGQPLPTQPVPREAPAPQAAPLGRSVETPAAPAPRRPQPETVTDDLSSNSQDETARPNLAEAMGARVIQSAAQGIALDNASSGTINDPHELARRQARMAPAEAQPPASTRVTAESVDNAPEALARGRAEMPPAQIGPTSLRVAAQQGDPGAAFEVGARFAEAKGVKQDYQQAIVWYSRAAQQGFAPAQYRLATIYEGGLHGTQDLPRARVWYKRAADQGNVKAMHNLAVLSAGNGQSQPDYATAGRWFAEAAERGLADSQFNLGVLHESGLGVAKDPLQAYKWFALAARSGDKESLRRRDQLMTTFTPQAAQQAEKLVNMWRAKPTDMKSNDPRAAAHAWHEQQARAAHEQEARAHQQHAQQQLQQQQQQQAQPRPSDAQSAQKAPTKATVQRATATIPRQ